MNALMRWQMWWATCRTERWRIGSPQGSGEPTGLTRRVKQLSRLVPGTEEATML
ncbi:hypothetical protein [Streptomyces sp. NPDC017993]|uniref:hypothetical protein n=1 Tax=Streptomyces sp. NPDC017993 TaxID=3365027 RepID=UPI0037B38B14